MKLELGKKYVLRNDPSTKWVRVEAISDEVKDQQSCVSILKCYANGTFELATRRYDGGFYVSGESTYDIVAEYKEPELCITEKDVGRKVRLRGGAISLITAFRPYTEFCVRIAEGVLRKNGRNNDIHKNLEDIIEFVD